MMTATIYREGFTLAEKIAGPLVLHLFDGETATTLRGFASKKDALAEAKRRGATVIPNA